MVSGFDGLAFEVFKVFTSPVLIMTAIGAIIIWGLIVGLIFSWLLKKYSFLGYPISNWPGCGFLAVFVFVSITFIQSLIGFRPLSDGISAVIATIIILLVYEFSIVLKRLLNKY